jgi:hypothetical protein
MATKVVRIDSPGSILQVHIELTGTKPKIWRRVLVPDTIKLEQLHSVIQRAFDWNHTHMHEFHTSEGDRYGSSDPFDAMEGVKSGANVSLTKVLRTATLKYVYDFGDYWEHRIKVEKTLAPDPQITLPRCIAGANAAPPDDCGGVPGYYRFVEIMADPDDPEHADMVDWIGRESWEPAAFDLDEINERLAEMKV